MKDFVLKVRLTGEEHQNLVNAAKDSKITVSTLIRGLIANFLEQETPPPMVVKENVPAREHVASAPAEIKQSKSGFKRSPRCENSRCERFSIACCDPCRKLNAKSFA